MAADKLSVVIITFNEADNIRRCLESLRGLPDEIVVVDSGSTDDTAAICAEYAVRFISQEFLGYAEQKNFALDQANHDIVLSLDADEALSPELHESVKAALANFTADGYTMNRLNDYGGKWVRHSGWYPDKKLRLWRKTKGRWGGGAIHESVQMEPGAKVAHLKGDLLHYSYKSISHHIAAFNRYSTIAAEEAFAKGRKINVFADIIMNPFFTFLKKYFVKLGFLDGYAGFCIAIHSSYGKFVKYAKLKELHDNMKKTEKHHGAD